MTKTVCLLLALAACAIAAPFSFEFTAEWEQWKSDFGRVYEDAEEELRRHIIWEAHKIYVDTHNEIADKLGFKLATNQFADVENSEFRRMNGLLLTRDPSLTRDDRLVNFNAEDLPATKDWRTENVVTPVKNQGSCGSCWAFSATGSLEGQHAIKTKKLVSLSEQQLVDCAGGQFGNHGCQGGLPDLAFKYIASVKGDDTEASYPYKAENGAKCLFNASNVGASDTSYKDIPSKNEVALKEAVANVGPISAGMDASHISLQLYHSGVYDPWFLCSQTRLDHGVLVVGYGAEKWLFGTHDYWLVKNSWGSGWGEKGYFKILRGDNKCGIATQASYPTGIN